MGTTLQKVENFQITDFNENVLADFSLASALMARIIRQKKPLQKAKMNKLLLLANTGITATLLEDTQQWEIDYLLLHRDFGREGWSWLAKYIQRNEGALEIIQSSSVVMARAKTEDLKAVWDENQSCEWWLLEHSQDQLPRRRRWEEEEDEEEEEKEENEWANWVAKFSRRPTDEDDVLVRGPVFEENEGDAEDMRNLLQENRNLAWKNFLGTLAYKKLKSAFRRSIQDYIDIHDKLSKDLEELSKHFD